MRQEPIREKKDIGRNISNQKKKRKHRECRKTGVGRQSKRTMKRETILERKKEIEKDQNSFLGQKTHPKGHIEVWECNTNERNDQTRRLTNLFVGK